MRLLQVSKCCLCANLRTGGLIIGYAYLLMAILHTPAIGMKGIFTGVIGVAAYAAWLYGIYRKLTKCMLPALCLTIFGLCVLLLILIVIPIVGVAFSDAIKKALEEDAQKKQQEADGSVAVVLIAAWLFVAFCAVIEWHVSSVMFSLYKTMKDGERPNAMYGA